MAGIHDGHRERMRQQYLKCGMDSFQTHQVLEMMLFYVVPRRDTNALAHRLLDIYKTLPAVLSAPIESLCAVEGVSDSVALYLHMCGDVMQRCRSNVDFDDDVFNVSTKVKAYIRPRFMGVKNEQLLLMCLDAKNHLLFCDFVSEGTITSTEIHVRRIMEKALSHKAAAIILAHNHPMGFARPSMEDRHATQVIGTVLGSVGIMLLDHWIVTDDDCLSMRSLPQNISLFRRLEQCVIRPMKKEASPRETTDGQSQ